VSIWLGTWRLIAGGGLGYEPRMRSKAIYRLKVTLEDIRPPIWRRLEVPGDIRFDALHDVIQLAFGWEDCHLHHFVLGKTTIGMHDGEAYGPQLDERKVRLDEIAEAKSKLIYEYDFGDGWRHRIVVEKVTPVPAGAAAPPPVCLGGARACPPEDCGGPYGYQEKLEVLADPTHEDRADLLEWLGGSFDAEAFDLEAINQTLRPAPRRRAAARFH
jgi:hypothetical protein